MITRSLAVLSFAVAFPAVAETYHLKLDQLQFSGDRGEVDAVLEARVWGELPSVRVPEKVEAHVAWVSPDENAAEPTGGAVRANRNRTTNGEYDLVIRVDGDDPVVGIADLKAEHGYGFDSFSFVFDPTEHKPTSEKVFERVKRAKYAALADSRAIGKQWFLQQSGGSQARQGRWSPSQSDMIRFFTGAQAVSDNLALDRDLILGRASEPVPADESVEGSPLADLEGVTVKPIDWSGMLPEGEIAVDALAHHVPEDQHIVVMPSLEQMMRLVSVIEDEGALLVESLSVYNTYGTLPTRYMKQMGVDFPSGLVKSLPVDSVAVTGGDPYFPLGSDVAVLFETDDAEALFKALKLAITLKSKMHDAGRTDALASDGVDYVGFTTADRSFSSHLVRFGDVVAVANSPVQVERLLSVHRDEVPALADLDEYAFFRSRYPLAEMTSGYAFLSDPCIRRWCGPRVRIGASRRIRAAVAIKQLAARKLAGGELSDEFAPLLGEVKEVGQTLTSEHFGSLAFMRPVSELEMDVVTAKEADAYARWKRGYEQGWRDVFDPIAISFDLADDSRSLDLSVVPLANDNEYSEMIEVVGGTQLSSVARSPHEEAVLWFSMALNPEGEFFQEFDQSLVGMLPELKVNPLSWVGDSITVFADQSPVWEVLRSGAGGVSFDELIDDLPVGVRVENRSSMKLAMVLAAMRTMAESSAPGALHWETRTFADKHKYVVVSSTDEFDFEICYAVTKSALLVSLNEPLLQRAMMREASDANPQVSATAHSAESAFLDGDIHTLMGMSSLMGESLEGDRQKESWRALPVLNDWHKRFPDEDPVAVHFRLFGERLACPGGKGFRWNGKEMTMESVAYGFPAMPRDEGAEIAILDQFTNFSGGLTFEDNGLRAAAKVEKKDRPEIAGVINEGGELLATAKGLVVTTKGAKWTYETVDRGFRGEGEETGTKVVEIVENDGDGGFVQHFDDGEDSDSDSITHLFLKDGLRCKRSVFGENYSVEYPEPFLMLPGELKEGMELLMRASYSSTDQDGESKGVELVHYKVLGLEDVEVPAGSYKYCVKVEGVHYRGGNGVEKWTQTDWYFPGVGLVKSSAVGAHFSAEWQLKKFDRPGE